MFSKRTLSPDKPYRSLESFIVHWNIQQLTPEVEVVVVAISVISEIISPPMKSYSPRTCCGSLELAIAPTRRRDCRLYHPNRARSIIVFSSWLYLIPPKAKRVCECVRGWG